MTYKEGCDFADPVIVGGRASGSEVEKGNIGRAGTGELYEPEMWDGFVLWQLVGLGCDKGGGPCPMPSGIVLKVDAYRYATSLVETNSQATLHSRLFRRSLKGPIIWILYKTGSSSCMSSDQVLWQSGVQEHFPCTEYQWGQIHSWKLVEDPSLITRQYPRLSH